MRKKLAGLFCAVVLVLVGLGLRITYINATSGEQYKKQVLTQSQQKYDSRTIPFKRGDIVDRNGTVLATSEKVYNVILDCKVVNSEKKYLEPTVKALVEVLKVEEAKIRRLLTEEKTKGSQYQIILKCISITDKKAFEAYKKTDNEELAKKEIEEKNNIKGVWFEENYKRTYPFNNLASHLLGFTYANNQADWGIEGYYSNILNGVDGRKYGYFNENADVEQNIINPKDGNVIVSTIDLSIQQMVENEIENMYKALSNGPHGKTGAKDIGVIVANPQNGEILAMASSGSFDLNNPRELTGFYSQEEIDALDEKGTTEALYDVWKNFCISDTFEPGSTVKPITVASALESGTVDANASFVCHGVKRVAGVPIKCANVNGHGTESLEGGIRDSCNPVMMEIAEAMGVDIFKKYQKLFNFGEKTGIDLPGEASGLLHADKDLRSVELATASFGQGYNCTMIQEVAAICAIANGGYYYQPHVVKQIKNSSGNVIKNMEPTLVRQVISSEVANTVKNYMRACVDEGTGKYGKVQGYSAGGKTGTAQKIPRGNGKYLISYIGITPIDNPQLVVYVVIDEPNVEQQADSKYSQFMARNIMKQVLPYLNIFPNEDENVVEYQSRNIASLPAFMQEAYLNNNTLYGNQVITDPEKKQEPETQEDTNLPNPVEGNEEESVTQNKVNQDGIPNDEHEINN